MIIFKLVALELLKQRRGPLLAFVLIGPLGALVLSYFPAASQGDITSLQWIGSLWRMWTLLICPLFMSLCIGSIAAIESGDRRWDSLSLGVYSPNLMYLAKFILGAFCFFVSNLLLVICSLIIFSVFGASVGLSVGSIILHGTIVSLSGLWLLAIYWSISIAVDNALILHAIAVLGVLASAMMRMSGSWISGNTPWGLLPFFQRDIPVMNAVSSLFATCFTVSVALLYFSRFPPGQSKAL